MNSKLTSTVKCLLIVTGLIVSTDLHATWTKDEINAAKDFCMSAEENFPAMYREMCDEIDNGSKINKEPWTNGNEWIQFIADYSNRVVDNLGAVKNLVKDAKTKSSSKVHDKK